MTAPYMLGTFEFINLTGLGLRGGAPETVRPTAVPIQRPGVPGTGFITTGIKAQRPFQMRSIVDVATGNVAQALCVSYEQKCNSGLLSIVHAGTDYSLTPVFNQYWILEVAAGWNRVASAVGGTSGGLYLVEAIWTLVPVYVEPPAP